MCGRYVTPDAETIARWLSRLSDGDALAERFFEWLRQNYNTSPTQTVPILRTVRKGVSGRELVPMRWGLIPFFAKGIDGGYSTFNAKMEEMRTKPSYRGPWKQGQRCIVLASGIYEWQAQPPDWQKTIPHYITLKDQEMMAMAGLWDESTTADGEIIQSCTIITMQANEFMANIHNSKKVGSKRVLLAPEQRRMPAILSRDDEEAWLSGSVDEAWAALKQYPSELMQSIPCASPKAGQEPLPLAATG